VKVIDVLLDPRGFHRPPLSFQSRKGVQVCVGEGNRESQADSLLSAEPGPGLDPRTLESWMLN